MIKLLDCTLRDGGYNNNWEFGSNNILKIYNGLVESNVDIIECGFLTQNISYNPEQSKFDSVEKVSELLHTSQNDCLSVCMINYGEYNINDLPHRKETYIDGIRVAFHKKDLKPTLEYCEKIKLKGYKVFIQPMVSMSYTDEEFIELIKLSNEIKPYAFYIVDSFGVMTKDDLLRLFYLVNHNLDKSIRIGFHSHNNLQLSYSNAQMLVDLNSSRDIIVDSSVMGMGRGAGNLNTELFIQYLNAKMVTKYKAEPLLRIIDEILTPIYYHNYWGYSLPYYLSASHNCHPNYATFLDNKNTLTVADINKILSMIPDDNKVNYSKEYIEELYFKYQSIKDYKKDSLSILREKLVNKEVLIIAPGSSIREEEAQIKEFISNKNNLVIIPVNFIPRFFDYDYLFVSNLKRYEQLQGKPYKNLILTSNINNTPDNAFVVSYPDLLNDNEAVADNSGLMLIKLLIKLGIHNIYLAGFDGYSQAIYDNFTQKDLAFIKKEEIMRSMNDGISKSLHELSKKVNIQFITKEHYICIK